MPSCCFIACITYEITLTELALLKRAMFITSVSYFASYYSHALLRHFRLSLCLPWSHTPLDYLLGPASPHSGLYALDACRHPVRQSTQPLPLPPCIHPDHPFSLHCGWSPSLLHLHVYPHYNVRLWSQHACSIGLHPTALFLHPTCHIPLTIFVSNGPDVSLSTHHLTVSRLNLGLLSLASSEDPRMFLH
jgi:hypothetical protein